MIAKASVETRSIEATSDSTALYRAANSTTTVASGKLQQRFSQIKIISVHGGGTIPFLVNRIQTLEHTFGVGPGRLELFSEEVREGIASFYYDLTAATSEAQLGAILKLVPVSQLLMGLDNPFMPKSTFALATADVGRYPAFSETDLRSISHANAFRLYPELAKRIGLGATEAPLDQTRVEFDEDKVDRIVNDVRDHAHLNARCATQDKYE